MTWKRVATAAVLIPFARPSIWERLFLLIPASVLAYGFIILPAMDFWRSYWLLKDGQKGAAQITALRAKSMVVYRYWVNQKEFTGQDRRTDADRRAASGHVEEERNPAVYYSASHPWLSRLHRPNTLIPSGLPVLIVAWIFLGLIFLVIVNPKSKWALQIGGVKANQQANMRA